MSAHHLTETYRGERIHPCSHRERAQTEKIYHLPALIDLSCNHSFYSDTSLFVGHTMNGEDTDSVGKPELRTAAIAVWHYWRMEGKGGGEAWAATLETEAKQSQRVEQFRAELYRIVGERENVKFRLNGGCVEAVVEDLWFLSYEYITPQIKEPYMMVSLLGRCPSCGVATRSEPIANLAGLGKMLESFKPACEHFCLSQQRVNSDKL